MHKQVCGTCKSSIHDHHRVILYNQLKKCSFQGKPNWKDHTLALFDHSYTGTVIEWSMHHVEFSARCQKQECAHCWSSVWILIVAQSRPELQDQTGGIVTQLWHFSEYAFVLRSTQMVKLLHQKKEAGKRCWHKTTRLILVETRNIPTNNLSQFKASKYIYIYTYLIVFVHNWKLLDSAELVAVVWTNTRKQPGKANKRQLSPSDHTADSSASYSPGLPVVETFLACAAQKEVLLAGDRILDTTGVIIPPNPRVNRLLCVAFFSAARRSPSPCRHIADS